MKKKRMILLSLIVIIMFLYIFTSVEFISSQIFIQNNISKINDTYIQVKSAAQGSSVNLLIGNNTNGISRGLIMFDISNLSSLNTIYDGKLQLYISNTAGGANRTIKLYRLTNSWVELEANWTNKNASTLWAASGADNDYDSSRLLNWTIISSTQTGVYYNFSIPGDIIKDWLNGTYENNGIIMISNDSIGTNFTIFSSSNAGSNTPVFIINYTANAPPSIISNSTDSNSLDRTQAGDPVTFTVNWTDMENDEARIFICNSSNIINYTSGCSDNTFCNTTLGSQGTYSCSYTTTESDNTTTPFYIGVCDAGSLNCTVSQKQYFYVNHAPKVKIIHPNGGETINQSKGNYLIQFNFTDKDKDFPPILIPTADIYYGESKNSTTYLIESSVDLSTYCTFGASITANCSYPWNTTGIWGTYYLTIIAHDYRSLSYNSSNSSFDVRSIIDTTPPNLTSHWIDSNDIYSGKTVQFFANATDDISMGRVWVNITDLSGTVIASLTMNNISANTYTVDWTAVGIGNYYYNVYASDKVGNFNDSLISQSFTIRRPNARVQNELYPTITLPYHLIMITGELNTSDSFKGVNATLNTPGGFTFFNGYPKDFSMGDFSGTNQAIWILSSPHALGTYTLNITYTDQYGNSYQGNDFNITVTQSIGNGTGGSGGNSSYTLSIAGYPYVIRKENYSVTAYFTQSGNLIQPDSMYITILQPDGSTVLGYPKPMTNITTGIFDHIAPTDLSWPEGQWETIINSTLNGQSYMEYQFWRLLGTIFDVSPPRVIDPHSNNLTLAVTLQNKGQQSGVDGKIIWNITSLSGNVLAYATQDTNVNAGEMKNFSITFDTSLSQNQNLLNYTGSANVIITYLYPSPTYGQIAGSSAIINIIAPGAEFCGDTTCNNAETCSSCPQDCGVCTTPNQGGGGGGGGGTTLITKQQQSILNITKFEPIIYLSQNMNKSVILEIKNTGNQTLSNILLTLENLNKNFYTFSPPMINSLNPGETKNFMINFQIKDFIGEQDFNYLVSSGNIQAKETGKLIVLSIKDFLLKEIELLEKRINDIKSETTDKNILSDLKNCEKILNESKSNYQNEDFIGLEDSLKRGDNCVTIIENRLKEKPMININNTTWIVISFIFLILLLLIAFAIYYTYRKTRALNVFTSKVSPKEKNPEEIKTMDEKYFSDKIKKIEDKLKD